VHTLAGLGGVGKTALAAQAARQVGGDFPGGILWLSLETGPKSAETLWTQIADAYGLPPSPDAAGNARAALERHASLLVVDNAESAPQVARELLAGRGAASLLLTTRDKRVAVGYGRPQDIAPLPRAEAVELFYAQAGQGPAQAGTGEDEALVEELCALLGDLPLALNLAAGYLNTYGEPLAGYLALLRGSPLGETLHLETRRDLSVPETLKLTYARLEDDACRALAALALDGGESSALQAMAAGAGWNEEGGGEGRARRACNELVRRSLAGRQGYRYHLHPLVRRYAAESTDEAERAGIWARLVAHYLAYARSHRQPTAAAYDALEAERDNLLAAMDRAYAEEGWAQVWGFAWALGPSGGPGFLMVRGYWGELRVRLEQAVRAAEAEGHQRDAAAFSGNLAAVLQDTGDLAAARREYQRVLAIFEELGERKSVATAYHQLGVLAQATGAYDEARRLYRQSLEIKEELRDKAGLASTLHELGRLAQATGAYDEARRLYRQSLEIKEELGNKAGLAQTLGAMAILTWHEGDLAEAERLYQQAMTAQQEIGDVVNASIHMFNLALLYEDQGRLNEALPLLERVVEIDERVGLPDLESDRRVLERVREKLGH
jgi:tetratricopeptide (TPR) repeat protein